MRKQILGMLVLALALGAGAADGTWIGGEGLWTDAANWKDGIVPDGAADTATFSGRTPAVVHLDKNIDLNKLVFTGADHQVTSNGTARATITFHPDADGAAEVRVDQGCAVEIAAHVYPNASGTLDLLKTGGGRVTFANGYMNNREYRSVDVRAGEWEHAKDMASGDYLKVSTIHVRKGATFRYVSANNVCNWAVFDLDAGATLDFNGQTDLVGSLCGAGRVINLNTQMRFGFKAGNTNFSGTVSGSNAMNIHYDARYPADYPIDVGLTVTRPDAFRDLGTLLVMKNWNDAVKFAAGNTDYWLRAFYGPEFQTFQVQDDAGDPITLHLATVQELRHYAGPGSISLWGGRACTILTNQLQIAGRFENASSGATVSLGNGTTPLDISTLAAVDVCDGAATALRPNAAQTFLMPFAARGGTFRFMESHPATIAALVALENGHLQFDAPSSGNLVGTAVTVKGSSTLGSGNGVVNTVGPLAREDHGVLFVRNTSYGAVAGTDFVLKSTEAPVVANGRTVLPVFQELFTSGRSVRPCLRPLTYDAEKGFMPATLTPGLADGASDVAYVTDAQTLAADAHVGGLVVECAGSTLARVVISSGKTLTVGDGVNPACVLLANDGNLWQHSTGRSAIEGGAIDFGASEGVFVCNSLAGDYIYYACVNSEIRGTGGVTFAAPGDGQQQRRQFSLATASTYTGGTWINGAVVRVANNGVFGADDVWVTGNSWSGGQIKTYSTAVTLPNNLHLSGVGQYGTFDTTYAQQAGSILVFGDLTLNGTVELVDDTRATVFAPYTGTFANTVSGKGGIELRGNGTFVFTKPNVWEGATKIGVNTDVRLSDGATLGQGAIEVNGSLTFNNTVDIEVTNHLTGSGTIVFAGTGKVTFLDAEDFVGQYKVGRTLDLAGQDMTLSALTGVGSVMNSGDDAQLTVDTDFTVTFDGVVSGADTGLAKTGAGTLALTGANTYGGHTELKAGGLRLGTSTAQATLAITKGLVCRLDATATATITRAPEPFADNVCSWVDADGRGVAFTNANTATAANGLAQDQPVFASGAINGKDALHINGYLNHLECDRNFTAGSIFLVHQGISETTHPNQSYSGDGWSCNGIFGVARSDSGLRSKNRRDWQYDSFVNPPGVIYVNGAKTGNFPAATPYVLSCNFGDTFTGRFVFGCYWYNGKNGSNFRQRTMPGDVGEVLVYNRQLDEFERNKVEEYLATKWLPQADGGASTVATNVLPATTTLTLSTGTRLDLNGSVQTVAGLNGNGSIGDEKGGGVLLVGSGFFDGAITGGTFGLAENGSLLLGDNCEVDESVSLHLAAGSVLDLGGKTLSVAHVTGTGTWINGRLRDLGRRGTVILFR